MADKKDYPLSLTIRAVDKATPTLGKVSAAVGKATKDSKGLGSAFMGVGKSIGSVGTAAFGLAKTFVGIGAGAALGIFAITKHAVDAGDKLDEMSKRVGVGVNAYAALQFAAAQADIDAESFNGAMDQFNKRLGELKQNVGPLKALPPIFVQQLKGAKSTEEAFGLATDAMQKFTTPAEKAAFAALLFGKSGLQMGQFLGEGKKALAERRAQFERLMGPQEAFAKGAGELDNAMRETEMAFTGVRNAAMAELFPAFIELSRAATDFLVKNRDGITKWAKEAGAAISKWVQNDGVGKLSRSLGELATTVGTVVDKLGGVEGVAKLAAVFLGRNLAVETGKLTIATAKLGIELATVGVQAAGWVKYLWMMRGSIGGAFVGMIGSATSAITAFGASLGPIALAAAPFLAVAAAIGAVGAALYQVNKHWDGLKEATGSDVWAWAKDLVGVKETEQQTLNRVNPLMGSASQLGPARMGPTTSQPVAPQQAQAKVTIDIPNLPKGARAYLDPRSSADLELNTGTTMASPL